MKETERQAVWEGGKERDSESRESMSWERQVGQQLWPGHRGPLGLGSPAKAHRSLSGPVLDRGVRQLGKAPCSPPAVPSPSFQQWPAHACSPCRANAGPTDNLHAHTITHTHSHILTITNQCSLCTCAHAHAQPRARMVSMTQGPPLCGKGKHRPRHTGALLIPCPPMLPVP